MKQLYNTSVIAITRGDDDAAVHASSLVNPQSNGLALQKSIIYAFLAYNKLMFQGSGPSRFYLLLQPLQQQYPQISFQPLFSATPSIIWTLPLASTLPSVSTLNQQEIQPLPQQLPAEVPNSTAVDAGVSEGNARVVRRGEGRRLRSRQKELQSAKKNSESNIVNQLFSFFNSYEKSECVVERAIARLGRSGGQLQKVKSMFYNIVRLINYRRGRKYVNKDNILAYYTTTRFLKQIPDITQKLAEVQLLTLEQLCYLFRATTAHFLTNISVNAILTSKRITILAKQEHLKRRRKVVHALTKQP